MIKIEITDKERRGLKALNNALLEINTACIDLRFEKHSWNENGESYLRIARRELTSVLANVNRDMLDSLEEDGKKM